MSLDLPVAPSGRTLHDAPEAGPERRTEFAALIPAGALAALDVDAARGLPADVVARRFATWGPNALASRRAPLGPALWHQLRSSLLGLLLVAATASYAVGERGAAVVIGVIVALSVGLGFVNEYRAEAAAEALHSEIRHRCVGRGGRLRTVEVDSLVPGDIVELRPGDIVPADLRRHHRCIGSSSTTDTTRVHQ